MILLNNKKYTYMKLIHTHSIFGIVDYHNNKYFSRKYNDYIHKFNSIKVRNNDDIYVSETGTIMFDKIVYPRNIKGYLYISGNCEICTPIMKMCYFIEKYDKNNDIITSKKLTEQELYSYIGDEDIEYKFPIYHDKVNNIKIIKCLVKEYICKENITFTNIKILYIRNLIKIEQLLFRHPLYEKYKIDKIKLISPKIPSSTYKLFDKKKCRFGKTIIPNRLIKLCNYLPIGNTNLFDLQLLLTSSRLYGTKGDILMFVYFINH